MKPFALKRYWPSFLLMAFASIMITMLYVNISDKTTLDIKQFKTISGDKDLLDDIELNVGSDMNAVRGIGDNLGTIIFHDDTFDFSGTPLMEKLDYRHEPQIQSLQQRYRNFMRPFQDKYDAIATETSDTVIIVSEPWPYSYRSDNNNSYRSDIDIGLLQKETETEKHFSVTVDLPDDETFFYISDLHLAQYLYVVLDVDSPDTDGNKQMLLTVDINSETILSAVTLGDEIEKQHGNADSFSLEAFSSTPTPVAWFSAGDYESEEDYYLAGYDMEKKSLFFLEQARTTSPNNVFTFNDMLYAVSADGQLQVDVYDIAKKSLRTSVTADIPLTDTYDTNFLLKDGLLYVLTLDYSSYDENGVPKEPGTANLYVIDIDTGDKRYQGQFTDVSPNLSITFAEDEL